MESGVPPVLRWAGAAKQMLCGASHILFAANLFWETQLSMIVFGKALNHQLGW